MGLLMSGAALVVTLATGVSAEIVSTTGQITKIAPPPSVRFHQLESNTTMFAFDEQQDVRLASNLKVDISAPGTYDDFSDLTPSTIPAGTVVSSHFVHADRVGRTTAGVTFDGTITTDTEIIGIIVTAPTLSASDFLGAPGTLYPTGVPARGLNFNQQSDYVIEQVNRRTVTIHVETHGHVDQIRVITRGERLGGEGCTPGFWKQPQHFDSWTVYSPSDSFEAVFGRDAFAGSPTLLQVLEQGGGGLNALGRHSVAGLLNAVSPDVDYAFTSSEVIAMFQDAFDSGDPSVIEATKDRLDAANNGGCTLS
jgi:hypothetical protein